MMEFDGEWWSLMLFNDKCRSLMVFFEEWSLMVFNDECRSLKVLDEEWWCLTEIVRAWCECRAFLIFDGECQCLWMFSGFCCIYFLRAWLTMVLLNQSQIIWTNSHLTFEHLWSPHTLSASFWAELGTVHWAEHQSAGFTALRHFNDLDEWKSLHTNVKNKHRWTCEYWTRKSAADMKVFLLVVCFRRRCNKRGMKRIVRCKGWPTP